MPQVEKVFLPDITINENEYYDASQMVRKLKQAYDSYIPADYKSVLTDYVEFIFEHFIEDEITIDKVSNAMFFEWIQFYLLFENKQLVIKDDSLCSFIAKTAQKEMIDYLLDLDLMEARMVHFLDDDEDDEEQLFLILDKTDQALCGLINKRAS